jgi:hypothetical protein
MGQFLKYICYILGIWIILSFPDWRLGQFWYLRSYWWRLGRYPVSQSGDICENVFSLGRHQHFFTLITYNHYLKYWIILNIHITFMRIRSCKSLFDLEYQEVQAWLHVFWCKKYFPLLCFDSWLIWPISYFHDSGTILLISNVKKRQKIITETIGKDIKIKI